MSTSHGAPTVGDLCWTRGRPAAPVLVLVVAHHGPVTRVRLTTGQTAMATGVEQLLRADAPARFGDLLVHEFPGYVWARELGPALATLDPAVDLVEQAAPELAGPADPRWDWKLAELARMQAWQPPLAAVLGEPD